MTAAEPFELIVVVKLDVRWVLSELPMTVTKDWVELSEHLNDPSDRRGTPSIGSTRWLVSRDEAQSINFELRFEWWERSRHYEATGSAMTTERRSVGLQFMSLQTPAV